MDGTLTCGKETVATFSGAFDKEYFNGSLTSEVMGDHLQLFRRFESVAGSPTESEALANEIAAHAWIIVFDEDETLAITDLKILPGKKAISFKADEGWYRIKYAYPDEEPIDERLSLIGEDLPEIDEEL